MIGCYAKAFYIGDKNISCAFMFLFRMNSTKKAETYVDAFFCYFIGNCTNHILLIMSIKKHFAADKLNCSAIRELR